MSDADPVIDALARAATVHLLPLLPPGSPDPPLWGTGFFVAPGLVLTCAHVLAPQLRGDRGRIFAVRGSEVAGGEALPARLERWLLDGDPRPEQRIPVAQDLALVRLVDGGLEHECVWLTDRTDYAGGRGVVQGYRPEEGGRAVRWKATARINGFDDDHGLRFRPDAEFPPGGSGSPVLDAHTGAVVGVLKSRRAGRDGGTAVAVTALRRLGPAYQPLVAAHDRWHGQSPKATGHNWIERQQQLPGSGVHTGGDQWSPRDRREALGLLAAVPPPDGIRPVAELARKARGGVAAPPGQLLPYAWRDGHGLLYEAGAPVAAIAALHYLQLVVAYERTRGGDASALAAWVARRLQEVPRIVHTVVTEASLPPGLVPPAPGAAPAASVVRYPRPGDGATVVVVELDPVLGAPGTPGAGRFYWRIRVDDGLDLNEPLHENQTGEGVLPGELVRHLRGPLVEVFATVDAPGAPAPLEVALPVDHFDTAVHRWQLTEMARLHQPAYVGVRRMVVLRDIARRGEPDPVRLRRWRAMERAGAPVAVRTPPLRQVPRSRHFQEMGPSAVPVLCRPVTTGPGRRAIGMALAAGCGIALWHTDGHPDHGCGDFCERFHDGAARLLEQTAEPVELPDRLRRLRDDISGTRNGGHWAESAALLYDDPGRPLPADDSGPVDSP
ncbi:VMAP-C domain-containing protein [Streptomyces yaizuensis]|uniref:Serine protease n=1 Tax=Streptomyces yaizuensis TaxID=2989713 RepID=A0ABQ5NW59_9ACTN|nr:trypsin-like peptidase domain-containing protein [Streptomyces sp. YSPA8]GLF94608.1 serine protease [Streptomyces sp. YSPA8]